MWTALSDAALTFLVGIVVALIGLRAQEGSRRRRLRREITEDIALLKLLEGRDDAARRVSEHVDKLLREYVPEPRSPVARQVARTHSFRVAGALLLVAAGSAASFSWFGADENPWATVISGIVVGVGAGGLAALLGRSAARSIESTE